MKLHRKIAKLFGYELIKTRKHPSTNSHVINLIHDYGIDLVIDVGANNGQFGRMIREEGYQGDIHSFEPVSKTYELLKENCANDPKWFTHKIALGDSCGEEDVNVTELSLLSSFLKPNDFGKRQIKKMMVLHTETVEMSTLETFVKQHIPDALDKRIFLKMDTQGYDLKVFKGAEGIFSNIFCILSEISLIPIYSDMPHYLDVLKEYESSEFVVTGFYPVCRDKNLSLIEMDCMLVNKKRMMI